MKSKRIINQVLFAFIVLVIGVSVASAQGPPPPHPYPTPGPGHYFDYLYEGLEEGKPFLPPFTQFQDSESDIESVTMESSLMEVITCMSPKNADAEPSGTIPQGPTLSLLAQQGFVIQMTIFSATPLI